MCVGPVELINTEAALVNAFLAKAEFYFCDGPSIKIQFKFPVFVEPEFQNLKNEFIWIKQTTKPFDKYRYEWKHVNLQNSG